MMSKRINRHFISCKKGIRIPTVASIRRSTKVQLTWKREYMFKNRLSADMSNIPRQPRPKDTTSTRVYVVVEAERTSRTEWPWTVDREF